MIRSRWSDCPDRTFRFDFSFSYWSAEKKFIRHCKLPSCEIVCLPCLCARYSKFIPAEARTANPVTTPSIIFIWRLVKYRNRIAASSQQLLLAMTRQCLNLKYLLQNSIAKSFYGSFLFICKANKDLLRKYHSSPIFWLKLAISCHYDKI